MTSSRAEKTAESYLGPAAARYFSHGYKNVRYSINRIACDFDAKEFSTIVDMQYPDDWSHKKDGSTRKAHLGTVDVFVLGVQTCSAFLVQYYGLSPSEVAKIWVRKVNMRSGNEPLEDLRDVTVAGSLSETVETSDALRGCVSSFKVSVGTIQLKLELDHDPGMGPCPSSSRLAIGGRRTRTFDIEAALGRLDNSYLGDLFRHYDRSITNIVIGESKDDLTATWHIRNQRAGHAVEGVGAAYVGALSTVDNILLGAQILQVLLYNYDDLDRQESNNLWMRSVSGSFSRPIYGVEEIAIRACLTRNEILSKGDSQWRLVTGEFGPVEHGHCLSSARAAHMLPKRV